jgi:hypothetical protein
MRTSDSVISLSVDDVSIEYICIASSLWLWLAVDQDGSGILVVKDGTGGRKLGRPV